MAKKKTAKKKAAKKHAVTKKTKRAAVKKARNKARRVPKKAKAGKPVKKKAAKKKTAKKSAKKLAGRAATMKKKTAKKKVVKKKATKKKPAAKKPAVKKVPAKKSPVKQSPVPPPIVASQVETTPATLSSPLPAAVIAPLEPEPVVAPVVARHLSPVVHAEKLPQLPDAEEIVNYVAECAMQVRDGQDYSEAGPLVEDLAEFLDRPLQDIAPALVRLQDEGYLRLSHELLPGATLALGTMLYPTVQGLLSHREFEGSDHMQVKELVERIRNES